nr:MAG TPA: hypothetical protein [Caudoviricetes sp.]
MKHGFCLWYNLLVIPRRLMKTKHSNKDNYGN